MTKKKIIAKQLKTNDEPASVLENSEISKLRAQVKDLSKEVSYLNIVKHTILVLLGTSNYYHDVLDQMICEYIDVLYKTGKGSKDRLFAIQQHLNKRKFLNTKFDM